MGHMISWKIENGVVIFVYAKNGKVEINDYFSNIDKDSIIYVRLADLGPTCMVKLSCRNKK